MSYDPNKIVFIDTETTGLDITRHSVWEIALIVWNAEHEGWDDHVFDIWPADLHMADPGALRINRFYERTDIPKNTGSGFWVSPNDVSDKIAHMTAGKVLIGANPGFDAAFVGKLLASCYFAPAWDYHMIDITSMAIGFLSGLRGDENFDFPIPYSSGWIANQLSIERSKERHTALGDAQEVQALWLRIMGEPE